MNAARHIAGFYLTALLSTALAAPLQICPAGSDLSNGAGLAALGDATNPRLLQLKNYTPIAVPSSADEQSMKGLVAQMSREGIALVIVPMPPPSLLYGDSSLFPSTFNQSQARDNHLTRLSVMRKNGLQVVNLLPIAEGLEGKNIPFFSLRDHHWTPAAMEASVQEIKRSIDSLKINIKRDAITKLVINRKPYNGSYADLLEKTCGPQPYRPAERDFYTLDIQSAETLLGEANTDTVVLGDSFAIDYFGLPQLLSDALKTPVIPGAVNGGGAVGGFTTYLSNLEIEAKPKLIVWVASGLYMYAGDIREINASVEDSLHNNKVLASASTISQGDFSLMLQAGGQAEFNAKYLTIQTDGPKTERLVVTMKYADGAVETRSFYRRQDAVKQSYTNQFNFQLIEGKALVSVSSSTPSGVQVAASIKSYSP